MFRWLFVIVLLFGCVAKHPPSSECNTIKDCTLVIKAKLTSNLSVKETSYPKPVVISFLLNDSAEVIAYEVLTDDNNEALEKAAIEAIRKSSPFTELFGLSKPDFEESKDIRLTVDFTQ
ncbi:hypothetical protein FJ444_12705 [Aestuariibacter sp. GS-14]|uniref:hypothetical protein n=1 Tax=Aestuariibacter sp. GS-14 TaxID=2590670 RepID=UPI00112A8350|nr:hypothetical protein [Aestuariibacter sp. GS-14]TPV57255.1 hypothetical protein FJ444_12705 [Aestuariibacter sp. GS-14]